MRSDIGNVVAMCVIAVTVIMLGGRETANQRAARLAISEALGRVQDKLNEPAFMWHDELGVQDYVLEACEADPKELIRCVRVAPDGPSDDPRYRVLEVSYFLEPRLTRPDEARPYARSKMELQKMPGARLVREIEFNNKVRRHLF
jgi:hypothetical protein